MVGKAGVCGLYVALSNVALTLGLLELLVAEVLIVYLVCCLLQILHVCPE